MRPGGGSGLSADLLFRNLGIAVALGDPLPIRPLTVVQLCRMAGVGRRTVYDAREANRLILRLFSHATDTPRDQADRTVRNARRRKRKPAEIDPDERESA